MSRTIVCLKHTIAYFGFLALFPNLSSHAPQTFTICHSIHFIPLSFSTYLLFLIHFITVTSTYPPPHHHLPCIFHDPLFRSFSFPFFFYFFVITPCQPCCNFHFISSIQTYSSHLLTHSLNSTRHFVHVFHNAFFSSIHHQHSSLYFYIPFASDPAFALWLSLSSVWVTPHSKNKKKNSLTTNTSLPT